MAVEVEASGQVEEFLRVLRQRTWFIVVPAALIITLGLSFAVIVPKKFVSEAQVMLIEQEGDKDGASTKAGRVAEHTIRSPKRVRAVLVELAWDDFIGLPVAEENLYVDRVLKRLEVSTPSMDRYSGQQLVKASFAHVDPVRAQAFLQLLMEKWQKEVLERRHTQVKQAFDDLQADMVELQKTIDAVNLESTELRSDYGVPPGERRNDRYEQPLAPEFERIEAEKERLAELEGELARERKALAQEQERHDLMDDQVPQVLTHQESETSRELEEVEEQIAEIQLAMTTSGWLPTHSKYIKAQRALEQLKAARDALLAVVDATLVEEVLVDNEEKFELGEQLEFRREQLAELEGDVEAQRALVGGLEDDVLLLQEAYTELEALAEKRDRLNKTLDKKALDFAAVKAERAQLEGPAGNPFEVLEAPTRPTRASEPDPILISLFSIFAGIAVGLGLAVVLEYSKSCFRSPGDLARVMVVPVLGTVNQITTRVQARRAAALRVAMGGATMVFVGTFAYVTWAWATRPELLSDPVLTLIDDLREAFK